MTENGTGYGCLTLQEFIGPNAYQDAVTFIGTLPGHERGRYWLDRCISGEGHIKGCDCRRLRDIDFSKIEVGE